MQIHVRLFARARELVGLPVVELDLPDTPTVGDLRSALTESYPALTPLASNLLIAVDDDYADDATVLSAAAQVACFPPVSGG